MRWTPGKKSEQIEDRRGQPAGGGGGVSAGGVRLLSFLFRRFGIVGVLVGGGALFLLSSLGEVGSGPGLGADPRGRRAATDTQEEPLVQFVSFVLDDAQTTWQRHLSATSQPYRLARLVLFRDVTRSGCGQGEAAMGPFYCPADEKVYLDLSFFDALQRRLGAGGDFAQAYVIAHELGHHVQHVLGTSERVSGGGRREGADGASVRLELQADCYAGVWGHAARARQLLDTGDLDEALKAASAIGDDALQRKASGRVRPETFSHGTSAQRSRWFHRGFASGDMSQCDTFRASNL